MKEFKVDEFQNLVHLFLVKIADFIPNILGAIIVFVLGIWIIRFIRKMVKKIMVRREVDLMLQSFLSKLVKWGLYIMLFLAVIQILGVPASSFIALLGTAGLAIGLALQGSLSNFAGGVMILIFKPFSIGDFIEAKGEKGTVKEIGLFTTTLNKFNNEEAIIPNGPLFANNIINYSREEKRRVKVLVGIGYRSDIKKAKDILLDIAQSNEKVLKEPAIQVFVEELADSCINLSVRFWCKNEDYWGLYFGTIEEIQHRFDEANIEIPFPKRDIYIKENTQKS